VIRSWGFQTITGAAQPLFGDKTTAAFKNNGQVYGRITNTSGEYTVSVAKASLYQLGDRIILGAGSPGANVLLVGGINTVTNILTCTSEGDAPVANWPSGTAIALSVHCYGILVSGLSGNLDSVWVGSDQTVTNAGGGSAFFEVAKVAAGAPQTPFTFWKYDGADPLNTNEVWVAGTAADKFAAAAFIN
jgi:hypothetical protein